MARAAILLAVLALLLVAANLAVGAAAGLGLASVRAHALVAIPTTVVALAAWSVVVLYFAGAAAWVAERSHGPDRGGPAAEARAVRRAALPWILAATLALIAAYVLGGGADTDAVADGVHLGTALLALACHLVAAWRTIILVGMMLDVQAGIAERGPAGPG